jgi:hypothetical protein
VIDPTTGEEITIPFPPTEEPTKEPMEGTTEAAATTTRHFVQSSTAFPTSTARVTSTQKPTTKAPATTKKPETTKAPETYSPPDRYVIGQNLSRSEIATASTAEQENVKEKNPKKYEIVNDQGHWLIARAPYDDSKTYDQQGLTLTVYLDPENDGSFDKVGTISKKPSGSGNMCLIGLVLDPNEKSYTDDLGKGIDNGFTFELRDPNHPNTAIDGVNYFTCPHQPTSLPLDNATYAIYQFTGSGFKKISQ